MFILANHNDLTSYLAGLGALKLDDPSLPSPPQGHLFQKEWSTAFSIPTLGAQLNFTPKASVTLLLFNGPEDRDEDGEAILAGAQPEPGPLQWRPDKRAMAVAKVQAELQGATTILDLKGHTQVRLLNYRSHDSKAPLVNSLTSDMTNFLSPFSISAVNALLPGEATAFQFTGALSGSLNLKWSEIFTYGLPSLGQAMGLAVPTGIGITVGGTLDVSYSVQDAFQVIFYKNDEVLRFKLHRAGARDLEIGIGVDISVGFNAKTIQAIQEKGTAVLEQLLAIPTGDLAKLKNALKTPDNIPPWVQPLVDKAADALGISHLKTDLATFSKKLDEFESTCQDKLKEAVTTKVTAGLSYHFSRTVSNDALCEGTVESLTTAGLSALVWANLPVIEQGISGINLTQFWIQSSTTTNSGLGFTLNFGKWKLAGLTNQKVTSVEKRRWDGALNCMRTQRSYHGLREYTDTWFGYDDCTWCVDTRADMGNYSTDSIPKLLEFAMGIHLVSARTFTPNIATLFAQLNWGLSWGALSDQALQDAVARSGLGQPVTITTELLIRPEYFHRVLTPLSMMDEAAWGRCFARVMPTPTLANLSHLSPKTRMDLRESIYGRSWAQLLSSSSDPDNLLGFGQDISRLLKAKGQEDRDHQDNWIETAHIEENASTPMHMPRMGWNTFAQVTRMFASRQLNAKVANIRFGLPLLRNALDQNASEQGQIQIAFEALQAFSSSSLALAALGSALAQASVQAGVGKVATVTITPSNRDPIVY